jgi:hypothetical protein
LGARSPAGTRTSEGKEPPTDATPWFINTIADSAERNVELGNSFGGDQLAGHITDRSDSSTPELA